MKAFTVTRKPEHEDYDSLHGSRQFAPDDFLVVVDGEAIGGTYWGEPADKGIYGGFAVGDGNWHSWGPAGLSMGHATREDAERAQVRAYALNPDLYDRSRADKEREREAELARKEAEWLERDRRRRLGDDEPGPTLWTLPACHHMYGSEDEVQAVCAWLSENGVDNLSGWQDAHLEQRTSRLALVYETPTAMANLVRGMGERSISLMDVTETRVATVTTMPPPVMTPPRPDLRPVFNQHYPAQFPLIDFGANIACAACTKAAKATHSSQMVPWPCAVVTAAIAGAASEDDLLELFVAKSGV
jgi:hypothetical protein